MPNKRSKSKIQKGNGNGYYNNNNNNNNNNGGQYYHHSSSGGGVYKHGSGNRNFNRKVFIKPSVLDAIDDENLQNRLRDNRNIDQEVEAKRGSNKNNRRRIDKLAEMGVVKGKKLTIGEDDKESVKPLLASQAHSQVSVCPREVFDMIVLYIQNYFSCFDTNRESLLGAYNQKCTFSVCLNMGNSVAHRSYRFEDNIVRESRNLKRLVGTDDHHDEKRFKLQRKGYIDVLSVLCKMPASEHDPRSFKLDVTFFSPTMITFNLSGVFKEGKATDKVRPLRSFHRSFVCIPDPKSQMSIINEHFVISNLTSSQFKTYYDEAPPSTSAQANDATPQTSSSNPEIQVVPNGLGEQQTLMIQQFSAESRLNLEWSKHCLEHAKWNYQEAAVAFLQFKDSLPQDAFIVNQI